MGLGLLLAALMTAGPFAAGEDFYGQNPVTLLNDPKVASAVGLAPDQQALIEKDLHDYVRLYAERAKLHIAKRKRMSEADEAELEELDH